MIKRDKTIRTQISKESKEFSELYRRNKSQETNLSFSRHLEALENKNIMLKHDKLFAPSILLLENEELRRHVSSADRDDRVILEVEQSYIDKLNFRSNKYYSKEDYQRSLSGLSRDALRFVKKKYTKNKPILVDSTSINLPLISTTSDREIELKANCTVDSNKLNTITEGTENSILPTQPVKRSLMSSKTEFKTPFKQKIRSKRLSVVPKRTMVVKTEETPVKPALKQLNTSKFPIKRKTGVNYRNREDILRYLYKETAKSKEDSKSEYNMMFDLINLKNRKPEGKKKLFDALISGKSETDISEMLTEYKNKAFNLNLSEMLLNSPQPNKKLLKKIQLPSKKAKRQGNLKNER